MFRFFIGDIYTWKSEVPLSQKGKKRKIFPIFRLLLKKYRFYGFYLGTVEKNVAELCNFGENLAKIAQLETFLLQKQIFTIYA